MPSVHLCCEPKIALKNKICLKNCYGISFILITEASFAFVFFCYPPPKILCLLLLPEALGGQGLSSSTCVAGDTQSPSASA